MLNVIENGIIIAALVWFRSVGFPVLVLRAGICLLIAPVPVHCFSITLNSSHQDNMSL